MEVKRLKLPIGIQTFEEIRKDGYTYVDKTKYLVNLIDSGKIYFLARPRRFGKSLTVTTLDALFSGRKDLFEGLYAEEFLNRPDFQPSPVIRLDMSKIATEKGIEGMEESMLMITKDAADQLGVKLSNAKIGGNLLNELIKKAAKKYNQKVVILLDEYDKPYTDFMFDHEMAEKVRNVLRSYYVQVKANDEYVRFTFITGISKFAKVGVFSTLNTPRDISLSREYAEICGYTEEEIIRYFPDYLEETASEMQITTDELINQMRYYYNGFSFDREVKTKLYNPYSTLTFFAERCFLNYWIDTGQPKFIGDYLKTQKLTIEQFRHYPVSIDFAKSPGDVDTTPPEGFLYQCGYLVLRSDDENQLYLDYPNTEVLNSMSKLVTQNILDRHINNIQADLFASLKYNDVDKLVEFLNTLLASIPYDDFSGAAKQNVYHNGYKFPAQEWLFRSSIFCYMRGCGLVVEAEMHSHLGRPDLVISYQRKTWVIEIKVAYEGQSPQAKAEEAYRQIVENQYTKPYQNVTSIGLGIDDAERQIKAVVSDKEDNDSNP